MHTIPISPEIFSSCSLRPFLPRRLVEGILPVVRVQPDPRPLVAFVMGPTGAGKSTLLDLLGSTERDDIAFIEVGKTLRSKYPPEHFTGQCNPEHVAEEAWGICESGVLRARDRGARLILVDGQPRDIPQVHLSLERFPDDEFRKHFLLLYAPLEERDRRVKPRKDYESLAKPRLTSDMIAYFAVIAELSRMGQEVEWAYTYDGGTRDMGVIPVPGQVAAYRAATRLLELAGKKPDASEDGLAYGGVVPDADRVESAPEVRPVPAASTADLDQRDRIISREPAKAPDGGPIISAFGDNGRQR